MPNYQTISRRLLWLLAAIPLLLSGCYATVRARPYDDYYYARGGGYYDRPYHYYAPPPGPRVVIAPGGYHGHWEHHRDYYRAPRVVEHRRHWRD
jgi:hypothetical protein